MMSSSNGDDDEQESISPPSGLLSNLSRGGERNGEGASSSLVDEERAFGELKVPLLDDNSQGRHSVRRRQSSSARLSPRFDVMDHFSLRSSVFRHEDKVIINGVRHQLIFDMEEDSGDRKSGKAVLNVKRASIYGGWVFFLKFLYVYIVVFLTGAAVVFCVLVCVQFGLGVFLVGIRSRNEPSERIATLLTLLGTPAIISTLSMLITLCFGFLNDVWNDFEFFHTMSFWSPIVRDWIILFAVVFFPLGTFSVSFLSSSASPQSDGLLAGLVCTLGLFLLVVLYTFAIEAYSCVKIIQNCVPEAGSSMSAAFCELIRFRLRQILRISYRPSSDAELDTDVVNLDEGRLIEEVGRRKPLSQVTKWFFNPISPRKRWELDAVLKPRPILSRSEFSSILFFCCLSRSRFSGSVSSTVVHSSFICVVITSFLIWFLFLSWLVYSEFIPRFLVVLAAFVAFLVFAWWMYRNFNFMKEFILRSQRLELEESEERQEEDNQEEEAHDEENAGEIGAGRQNYRSPNLNMDKFDKYESLRRTEFVVAEPKLFTSILLLISISVVFVAIPSYAFYSLGVKGYGGFFTFCVVLYAFKLLFYIPSLVEHFGPIAFESLELPLFDFMQENQEDAQNLNISSAGFGMLGDFSGAATAQMEAQRLNSSPYRRQQSAKISNAGRRVYLVLTRMTKQQIRTFWLGIFALSFIFMVLLIGFSVDQDTTRSDYEGVPLLGNATHPTHKVPMPSKREIGFDYPACTLLDELYSSEDEKDFLSFPPFPPKPPHWRTNPVWSTLDFAFLSDLAYSHAETTQYQLDKWFGPGVADYIPPELYPTYATERKSSAVFKLVRTKWKPREHSSSHREFFLVSIRGTINTYDLLSDMQIWFPALLFQFLRYTLPFGELWDAVIPSLIMYMGVLETAPASRISYQSDITDFVSALIDKHPTALVVVTGHSLGGGIAMLVGAEKQIPAVAFSGPNAMLSRRKFGISKKDLDAFAVNIIPRGDPVPTVDDQALLTESILCRAKRGEYFGACHEIKRTMCELEHVCGSGPRPPIAICNETYDFPAAIPLN